MKHFTIKHLILSITIPASLAIVYGGSPAGNPQGTTWPSRPKCDSLITGDMVFTFHSINLRYSLDDYGDAVNPDLIELSNAHGINSANKSGSMTTSPNFCVPMASAMTTTIRANMCSLRLAIFCMTNPLFLQRPFTAWKKSLPDSLRECT